MPVFLTAVVPSAFITVKKIYSHNKMQIKFLILSRSLFLMSHCDCDRMTASDYFCMASMVFEKKTTPAIYRQSHM